MSNSAREATARGLSLGVLLFWFVIAATVYYAVAEEAPDGRPLGKIKIRSFDKERVAEWDREKTIDFAMQQSAKLIDYLFIASVAVIGFVAKSFIIDLDAHDPPRWQPGIWGKVLVIFVLVFFGLSLGSGILAYGEFPHLATSEEFSIYEDTGTWAGFQQLFFVAGTLALGVLCTFRLCRMKY